MHFVNEVYAIHIYYNNWHYLIAVDTCSSCHREICVILLFFWIVDLYKKYRKKIEK